MVFFFFFPLNQASMGLIVWWSSWFDVANRGGVMVVDRWVVVVLLMVDRGGLWMGLMVDRGGVVVCARGLFGVWDEFLY